MQEVVRHRLVASAARHFARDGLDRARIDAISRDAGFAKGTVYNYFASKEELFGAVVEEGAARAARRFRDLDPGGGVRARLLAVAEADVSVLREEEDFTKVIVREAMSFRPDTYPMIATHLAPYVLTVAGILADGVRDETIRAHRPPEQLALLFVGILSLLYVQRWGSGGAWPALEEIPALAVTSFLDGAATAAERGGRT